MALEDQLEVLIAEFRTTIWPQLRASNGGHSDYRCVDQGTRFDIDVMPGADGGLGYCKITCDPPGNRFTFSLELEMSQTDGTEVQTYTNLSQGSLDAMQRVIDLWNGGQFTRMGNGQRGRKPSKPGGRPDNEGQGQQGFGVGRR